MLEMTEGGNSKAQCTVDTDMIPGTYEEYGHDRQSLFIFSQIQLVPHLIRAPLKQRAEEVTKAKAKA